MTFPQRFSDLPDYAFPRLRKLLDGHAPGGPAIDMTIGEPKHPMPAFVGEVLADNLRSQSLHLRLGFALEQRRAAQALKEGIPRDVLRYRLDLTA